MDFLIIFLIQNSSKAIYVLTKHYKTDLPIPSHWKPRCFRAQKDFPSASVQLGGRTHAEHCRKVFLSILFHLSSLPECLSIISDEWLTGGWWEVILLMLLIVQKTLYRDHFPNDIPHDTFPFIHDNEENVFDQIKHIWCSDLRKGKGGWRNISRFFPSLHPSVTNHKQVDKTKEDIIFFTTAVPGAPTKGSEGRTKMFGRSLSRLFRAIAY